MALRIVLATLLVAAFGLVLVGCAGGNTPSGVAILPAPGATEELDGTITFWQGRVEMDDGDFVAQNRLGNSYLSRARMTGDVADYQRAEAAYEASLEALPGDNPGALLGLAFVSAAQHDFDGALTLAERTLELDPGEVGAIALSGDALMALGRYADAGDAYARANELEPGLGSLGQLAILHSTLGDVAAAEATWHEALASENATVSERAWGLTEFGHLEFATGDYTYALDLYRRALDVEPGYLSAVVGLADALSATGDAGEAIATYESVIERAPSPEVALRLGDLFAAEGRDDDADRQYALVEAFQALYEANGVSADITMVLYLADHGRADEAVTRARAIYAERPGIYAADALAWALAQDSQLDEASEFAAEAMRFRTPEARFAFHAGVIQQRLGNNAEAETLLSAALDLSPVFSVRESAEARALLADPSLRVAVAR